MGKLKSGLSDEAKGSLFAGSRRNNHWETDNAVPVKTDPAPWKIMITDNDGALHQVTLIILVDYKFEGQPMEIIQGYSDGAGRNLMKKHLDTVVLLLDVVMETDTAGLAW